MISGVFRPKVNGAVIAVENLMDCLRRGGHEVDLLTRRLRGTPKVQLLDGSLICRTGPPGISYPDRLRLSLMQILAGVRMFRSTNYDVIHCHGFAALLSGLCLGRLFDKPVVVTFHGFTSQHGQTARRGRAPDLVFAVLRPLEKALISKSAYVTAESPEFADLIGRLYQPKSSKMRVIPHLVDTDFFRLEESKPDRPTILFVGGLTRIHGPEFLIESVSRLKKLVPTFKLVLVGDGPRRAICEKMAQDLNLGENIVFTGVVRDRKKLQQIYSDSWVLTIPQDYAGYFLSLAALEAMATGRPVVATQTLDPRLAEHGVFAVRRNSSDLANMLAKLVLLNQEEYSKLALSARTYVENNCSFGQVCGQLEELYTSALKTRASQPTLVGPRRTYVC